MPSKSANRLYAAMNQMRTGLKVPAVNVQTCIRMAGLTEEEGKAALKELEDAGMVRNAGTTIREDY